MFMRLLLVLHQGDTKKIQNYVIFKCGYFSKEDYKHFIINLHEVYSRQWIPKNYFVWNELLIQQISQLMQEWKECDEYSKRITTEVMHDENSYKHLQNLKTKIKQKLTKLSIYFEFF